MTLTILDAPFGSNPGSFNFDGTPFCICLDYDTKEDNTVTVRDRDSMEQVRMPMDEVAEYIQKKCTHERD